jgi:hypothetical protein
VHTGVHVTSPSILLENRDWLTEHASHAFVDPEIALLGPPPRTARESVSATCTSFPTISLAITPPICPTSVTATLSSDAPS